MLSGKDKAIEVPKENIPNVEVKDDEKSPKVYEVKMIMVGDALKKGDVIGTAGENKIDSTYDYMLLFEVEHNGTFVNPENIFGMNVKELS